jgi:predicted 3-demethylubiquinone-9 3-methyltransferase (glyoxalase superfamily)
MEEPMPKISPFLWFDKEAEEAATFYVSVFPNSKLGEVQRYPEGAPGPAGTAMTVAFELDGESFTALNGGPVFQFNEAISFVIDCADQAEVDYFWDRLTADGGQPVQCGWLKDKFGLSWQVVPKALHETTGGPDAAGRQRAFDAMMQMVKLDVAKLRAAYAG